MAFNKRFTHWVGAAGVAGTENHRARCFGVYFEIPMLMAALWILFSWFGITDHQQEDQRNRYDLALWALFAAETVILSWLVDNRVQYLRGNWLNLVIVVLGLPILLGWDLNLGALRILRILSIAALLLHIGGSVRKMLSRNELGTTLIASAIIIVMAGVMMALLDPGIDTPWDGIWWAWVTVTTVGYGDIVPLSAAGRAFAGLIILMGIGLFSMITATFAAFFISRQEEEMVSTEAAMADRISQLEESIARMENKLDQLINKQE